MEEMICRRAKSLDASGDREYGEDDDDELPCVIGESVRNKQTAGQNGPQ